MSFLSFPHKLAPPKVAQSRVALPVAQTSSLPYRGFPIRRRAITCWLPSFPSLAGWKPAIQQTGSLRYLAPRCAAACVALFLGLPGLLLADGTFVTNGIEYPIAGTKPGDQVHPAIALNSSGGFLVWEDNATSANGIAVNAQRLDGNASASFSSFKINSSTVGDHQRAQVALLNNGGAAFAWQGGKFGYQHIYARFLSSSNTWLSGDIMVNSSSNYYQLHPAIATLSGGNVVVVWSSFNQYDSTSMRDVYGQVFSPDGQKVGGEFLVNQFTAYNQRTPAVAALTTGGFVVDWVSEQERVLGQTSGQLAMASQLPAASVDIYARLFTATGLPAGNEFLVNTDSNICANPTLAATPGGGFIAGWGQFDRDVPSNGWDIFARSFSSAGTGGAVARINTQTFGDQFGAQLSVSGSDVLMVWTSLGQDGSMEGIYGQFLHSDVSTNGSEFRVNTTWVSKQMHPAVAADANGRFLVTWTSFNGGLTTFDLFAQRYVSLAQPLAAMAAPFVYVPFIASNGVYQPQVVVSWPVQTGLPVDHYGVYVDGTMAASPATNTWTMTAANGLTASSTHSFQLTAVGSDGSQTPLSPAATATTWSGNNWAGIPFEWMTQFYGADGSRWPSASASVATGGPTLYQVFLTGGNPLNSATWLRTSLDAIAVQGQPVYMLHWNTQPGLTYQVQTSSDMMTWSNFQSPRFAADVVDSVQVPSNNLQVLSPRPLALTRDFYAQIR